MTTITARILADVSTAVDDTGILHDRAAAILIQGRVLVGTNVLLNIGAAEDIDYGHLHLLTEQLRPAARIEILGEHVNGILAVTSTLTERLKQAPPLSVA